MKLTTPTNQQYIAILLIVLAICARILPHPANIAPISAIALFSGLYLSRRLALTLPIIGLVISDFIIGFYDTRIMIAVYASILITAGIGILLQQKKRPTYLLAGTLLGSIIFFIITNAAVWLFGTMYPHTIHGLMTSYTMAIPFFRNSVLGDLMFSTILIGSYELLTHIITAKKSAQDVKQAV